jgi:hypothetical protein
MSIASGQRFDCAISEEYLNQQVSRVPDLPCSDVNITLQDGLVKLSCRLAIRISATMEVKAEGCRLSLRVIKAPLGTAQVLQDVIDTQMAVIPYDAICFERAAVSQGQIEISGYGR